MKLNFNENLVRYRKRAGLTQQQLAQKLSITPQAVSKWEKGSYPDCELLPKLSQILDVSLDVLFGLKDEDGKISLNTAVIEEVGKLDEAEKGKRAMELIYTLLCAFRTGPSPEHASLPESLTRETYAQVRTDNALAIARLNPDMQYACFMRIPEDGINSYFSIEPRLLELFSLLSDENAMKVISYAETLSRNNILTKECISKELDMPQETVSVIVDRCEKLGIMWQLTANTGGETFPIYGYVHNVPLVGILTLAKSLVNYISFPEPDIDSWTRAPFRHKAQDTENSEE